MSPLDTQAKIEESKDAEDVKIEPQELEISIRRGIITTVLFYSLYHYQRFMKNNQKKHSFHSFSLFLIFMICINYSVMKFTPEFSKHMISGIGWGIGAVLINKILEL